MSGNLSDQEFETGARLIREAYSRKLAHKETEVVQLRGELARKEADIKELTLRVAQLEQQLVKSERKQQDLSKQAAKLQHFRQVVLESFAQDGASFNSAIDTHGQAALFGSSVGEKSPTLSTMGRNTKPNFDFSINSPASPSLMTSPRPTNKDYTTQSTVPPRIEDFQVSTDKPVRNQPTQQTQTQYQHPQQQHRPSTTMTQSIKQHVINEEPLNVATRPLSKQDSTVNGHTSQQQHRPSSTTTTGKPAEAVVDGREFFRKAKSILSYDDFTSLLWNVKAYNNRDQTRARTLENVFQSIGHKHPVIHEEFERLLSR